MSPETFYPDTCCHPVSRRQLLVGSLGAVAGAVLGRSLPAWADAGEDSRAIIQAHATRPDDPWALVHGVRALGPGFTVQGGEPAVPFVLRTFLEDVAVNGRRHLAFPQTVERHQNSFLKTFLEAGVPPALTFSSGGRRRTLQEVVEGARALFRFSDRTDRNEIAWSMIALTATTPPAQGAWTNAWGERVDLGRVVEAGLETMEQASRPIGEARERGVVPERQAPVHAFTCGGTHLLYSLLAAARAGYLGAEGRRRLGHQMDLLVYRLTTDVQMIERFYGPRMTKTPGMGWYQLDARLKFVGHALECLGLARRHGLYTVPAAEAHRYDEARAVLDADLRQLRERDLEPVRKNIGELYSQLVGDTCHAHHGLRFI